MDFIDDISIKEEHVNVTGESMDDIVEEYIDFADDDDVADDVVDGASDDGAYDNDFQCLKIETLPVDDDEPVVVTSTASNTDAVEKVKIKMKNSKGTKIEKQCNVCGLIVERLRDHMKTAHPDAIDYKCSKCPRKYLTQTGLDRHTYYQHPDEKG